VIDKTLYDLLYPSIIALGYELWGVERISQGRQGLLLRVYIDHENGILVNDCAKISHQVDGVLTVEEAIQGEYTLEVSSPGLDRPLFMPAQYHAFIGHKIKIGLRMAQQNRRHFTGLLMSTDEQGIVLEDDQIQYELDWKNIDRAHLLASNTVAGKSS